MQKPLVTCVVCGKPFDPRESLVGDQKECQLCWEGYCANQFWRLFPHLPLSKEWP